METYAITIIVTIDTPNHDEALKIQQDITNHVVNYEYEGLNPVSKVTAKMREV